MHFRSFLRGLLRDLMRGRGRCWWEWLGSAWGEPGFTRFFFEVGSW